MYYRIWAIVIIVVAIILALLASIWPQERLADIIYVTRIFDVMIPVLAVGALVKYLFKCGRCVNCDREVKYREVK